MSKRFLEKLGFLYRMEVYAIIISYSLSFTEMSLSQSRSQRIQEAMKAIYLKASRPEAAVLITTADEDNKRAGQNLGGKIQNSGIETTINVILHAKKIKRDLHIQ